MPSGHPFSRSLNQVFSQLLLSTGKNAIRLFFPKKDEHPYMESLFWCVFEFWWFFRESFPVSTIPQTSNGKTMDCSERHSYYIRGVRKGTHVDKGKMYHIEK